MADIFVATESVPTTPSAGNALVWVDSTAKILCVKDDAGRVAASSENASIAALTVNAADTYITNSDILIPTFGLQARTKFLWMLSASKTAAGVAAPIYNIRIGAARTTADTARLVLTGPAQTAIADIGTLFIMLTVRSIGAAGVLQGTAWWVHRGTAVSSTIGVGFANDGTGHIEGTSAGFDMTTLAGSYVGLSTNSGAAGVWTVTQAQVSAQW